MNRHNIERLIAHLRQPRRPGFGMEAYYGYREECGTCLCLAGHSAMLAVSSHTHQPLKRLSDLGHDGNEAMIAVLARDFLGLDDWQAHQLFVPPIAFTPGFIRLSSFSVAAGVRVLELLLISEEVQWGQAIEDTAGVPVEPLNWEATVQPLFRVPAAEVAEMMKVMKAKWDFETCHYLALLANSTIDVAPPAAPAKPNPLAVFQQMLLDPKDPNDESEDDAEEEEEDDQDKDTHGDPNGNAETIQCRLAPADHTL